MKTRPFCASVLLSLCLAGCRHPAKVASVAAPALPEINPVMVNVPPPTHRDLSEIPVANIPAPPPTPEPTRRPSRSSRRSTTPSATAPPAQAAVPASTAPSTPPPIALGELSAGGEVSNGLRQQTADLLKSQQQRLDAMDRTRVSAHSTEVAQARTFLQRANTSWNAADYEGAHTLAVKAKVLLDDLKD